MCELITSSLASIRAETKACEERPDGASQYEGQGHYQVKKLKVTFLQIHLLFM